MKKQDISMKNNAELHILLNEARIKLGQLRFDLADKKLKRTSEVRQVRVQIARLMTALKAQS